MGNSQGRRSKKVVPKINYDSVQVENGIVFDEKVEPEEQDCTRTEVEQAQKKKTPRAVKSDLESSLNDIINSTEQVTEIGDLSIDANQNECFIADIKDCEVHKVPSLESPAECVISVYNSSDDESFFESPRSSYGSDITMRECELSRDKVLQKYSDSVKRNLHKHGFFDTFPTPQVLQQAQTVYRELALLPPADGRGRVLPYPTPSSKSQLLSSISLPDFYSQTPKIPDSPHDEDQAFQDIAKKLRQKDFNDVQRVWLIFKWIVFNSNTRSTEDVRKQWLSNAVENAQRLLRGTVEKRDAAEGSNQHPGIEDQHWELFKLLCRIGHIPCQSIKGYKRTTNQKTKKSKWSAVFVQGSWRFIDIQNATNIALATTKTSQNMDYEQIDCGKKLIKRHNERSIESPTFNEVMNDKDTESNFYFLIDPEQFIFSHIPEEECWQLLARPVTDHEAQHLPCLSHTFFLFGLFLESPSKCAVVCETGDITIELGVQNSQKSELELEYRLHAGKMSTSENSKDLVNKRNKPIVKMLTINQDQNISVKIHIYFSSPGCYKLDILGKDRSKYTSLSELCSFTISCTKSINTCLSNTNHTKQKQHFDELGLNPLTHKLQNIVTDTGDFEIRFQVAKPLDFRQELSFLGGHSEDMQHNIFHRLENGEVIFRLRLPKIGEYELKLFVNDSGDEISYHQFFDYLISCKDVSNRYIPFPKVGCGRLGPTRKCKSLGVTFNTHTSSFIIVPDTGKVQLLFGVDSPMTFVPELKLQNEASVEDFTSHVMWHVTDNIGSVFVNAPKQGLYGFSLYGKSVGERGPLCPLYYSILEVNIPSIQPHPFPKIFSCWTCGCYLLNPLSRYLLPKTKVKFSVCIPEVVDVAIVGSNGWAHLEKTPEGLWEGEVTTGPRGTFVKLSARTEKGSDYFSTFLMYQVISKHELELEGEKQTEVIEVAKRRVDEAIQDAAQKADDNHCLSGGVTEGYPITKAYTTFRIGATRKVPRTRNSSSKSTASEAFVPSSNKENWMKIKPSIDPHKDISTKTARKPPSNLLAKNRHTREISKEAMLLHRQKTQLSVKSIPTRRLSVPGLSTTRQTRDNRPRSDSTDGSNMALQVDSRSSDRIRTVLQDLQDMDHTRPVSVEIKQAQSRLKSLERVAKLSSAILNMDSATMMEVRHYKRPPDVVHQVMRAALLLLGDDEEDITEWRTCQRKCVSIGPDGLNRRVRNFDITLLDPEVALRVKLALDQTTMDEVNDVSAGAAVFYRWAKGIAEEVLPDATEPLSLPDPTD